ncbi:MAG TPA: hypothetical protein VM925_08975 [Labilithrix sp.]|nr:hypothetical protein [Labilithrix sp.]
MRASSLRALREVEAFELGSALLGDLRALGLVAEIVAERSDVRALVRGRFDRDGLVESSAVKSKTKEPTKFEAYYDFSERAKTILSHRWLAPRPKAYCASKSDQARARARALRPGSGGILGAELVTCFYSLLPAVAQTNTRTTRIASRRCRSRPATPRASGGVMRVTQGSKDDG